MDVIRWNKAMHQSSAFTVDGPWGRYMVKREGRSVRWFVATLNDKSTTYGGPTLSEAMKSVERVIVANHSTYSLERVVRP